jgi:hypothetical protein
VPQAISEATNLPPGDIWTKLHGEIIKFYGSFANNKKAVFDSHDRLFGCSE